MTDTLRCSLLRALAFHDAWRHAPTLPEWVLSLEWSGPAPQRSILMDGIHDLVQDGTVMFAGGRYGLSSSAPSLLSVQRENEGWQPLKWRVVKRVAAWLSCLQSVRFIAVCNTMALGHASDGSDLDFFVVTSQGKLMTTRGLGVLPFHVLGRRPGEGHDRDAVCLSYFVSEDGLDLSSHQLQPDDPYFRYWFLSLLPIYDDGMLSNLWEANRFITRRYPFAHPWIPSPALSVNRPRFRLPVLKSLERVVTDYQRARFPDAIRTQMNLDTRVMVTSRVLKFHVDDGREGYRQTFYDTCRRLGI